MFSIIQTMQIKRPTHHNRLDETLAYIARHMKERIQLDRLCKASGVSKRTLGYLFLHTYGITPMAFLKQERLRKARMLLQHADPSTATVASIARESGFAHMGQFSLDYKRLFGELPLACTTTKKPTRAQTFSNQLASDSVPDPVPIAPCVFLIASGQVDGNTELISINGRQCRIE
ncbi:MAG: helix-turn-helix domain-containing protein [Marinobacter sp.]